MIGFWGLRIFFNKGIINPNYERTLLVEALSVYVHGGSFLTMFYFVNNNQVVLVTSKTPKYFVHLNWGVPYLAIQFLHWYFTGEHVYGFLKYFSWIQLAVFEVGLYYLAVSIDFSINLRYGLKLSQEYLKEHNLSFDTLELEKQKKEELEF